MPKIINQRTSKFNKTTSLSALNEIMRNTRRLVNQNSSVVSGAATEAKQDVGNTSLSNIDTNTEKIDRIKGNTTNRLSEKASTVVKDLVAVNPNRIHVTLYNDSTDTLYVIEGSGGSTTNYSYQLPPDGRIHINHTTDLIRGVWSGTNGDVYITETTYV